MFHLLNHVGILLGLVASFLSIVQFFRGQDKDQRNRELQDRFAELAAKLAELSRSPSAIPLEEGKYFEREVPRLKFKHLAHSYDRLLQNCKRAVGVFSGIVFVILLSLFRENYFPPAILLHIVAVWPLGRIIYYPIRLKIFAQMEDIVSKSGFSDTEVGELKIWINNEPWIRESTTSKVLRRKLNDWYNTF